jgi:hypothetical protein
MELTAQPAWAQARAIPPCSQIAPLHGGKQISIQVMPARSTAGWSTTCRGGGNAAPAIPRTAAAAFTPAAARRDASSSASHAVTHSSYPTPWTLTRSVHDAAMLQPGDPTTRAPLQSLTNAGGRDNAARERSAPRQQAQQQGWDKARPSGSPGGAKHGLQSSQLLARGAATGARAPAGDAGSSSVIARMRALNASLEQSASQAQQRLLSQRARTRPGGW